MFQVRTRYGWGWEVVGDKWQSWPIETATAAEELAADLNGGTAIEDALESREKAGRFVFDNGRIYTP